MKRLVFITDSLSLFLKFVLCRLISRHFFLFLYETKNVSSDGGLTRFFLLYKYHILTLVQHYEIFSISFHFFFSWGRGVLNVYFNLSIANQIIYKHLIVEKFFLLKNSCARTRIRAVG